MSCIHPVAQLKDSAWIIIALVSALTICSSITLELLISCLRRFSFFFFGRFTQIVTKGEEITFPYVESPSKARLLTSFGFMDGAPAASLAANDLPVRDVEWLRMNGCIGTTRTVRVCPASTFVSY